MFFVPKYQNKCDVLCLFDFKCGILFPNIELYLICKIDERLDDQCILMFQHVLFLINLQSSKPAATIILKYYDAFHKQYVYVLSPKEDYINMFSNLHLSFPCTDLAIICWMRCQCFDRLINIFICLCPFSFHRIGLLHQMQILRVGYLQCVHC